MDLLGRVYTPEIPPDKNQDWIEKTPAWKKIVLNTRHILPFIDATIA
jgi:hypothetical protein